MPSTKLALALLQHQKIPVRPSEHRNPRVPHPCACKTRHLFLGTSSLPAPEPSPGSSAQLNLSSTISDTDFPIFSPIFTLIPCQAFSQQHLQGGQGFPSSSSSSSLAKSPSGIHVAALAKWDLAEKCHVPSGNPGHTSTGTHREITSRLFCIFFFSSPKCGAHA